MKIAAIDVGTNSIRTIIAIVHGDGTFQVVDQLREMVRLGEGESPTAGMTPRAFADGLSVLSKARVLCDAHRVDHIVAVATSAVREAVNGGRFVDQVQQRTGIELEVISAEKEARLIYAGARGCMPTGDRRGLFIDVGGGSVEFIIGDQAIHFIASVKLGGLRLLNRFPMSDPIKPRQIEAVREYIAATLEPVLSRIRSVGFDSVIGTSGTSLTLTSLVLERERHNGAEPPSLNRQTVSAAELLSVCKWLIQSTAAERRQINRIQPGRLNSIVMGAILWQCMVEQLGIRSVTACDYALREGVLIDYIESHLPGIRQWEKYPNPRRRSAIALAQRCNWDEAHSRQVAVLALSLFDQLQPLHHLDARAREWLDYAALLHDIGYHISARAHHRHSYYLILHGDLLGFSQQEVRTIAAVARYHRKRKPERGDPELTGLDGGTRRTIEILSGILRIADALDRTHNRIARQVKVQTRNRSLQLQLIARGDAELEQWFAAQEAALLQDVLKLKIQITVAESLRPILQDSRENE